MNVIIHDPIIQPINALAKIMARAQSECSAWAEESERERLHAERVAFKRLQEANEKKEAEK